MRVERSTHMANSIMSVDFPETGQAATKKYSWLRYSWNSRAIRIHPEFDIIDVCFHADNVVSAAASVIEAALQYTNAILEFQIPKSKLSWFGRNSLRSCLTESARYSELLELCDRVFGTWGGDRQSPKAVGYQLLKGYRDWVIHRGAPLVDLSTMDEKYFQLPDELAEGIPEEDLNILLGSHGFSSQKLNIDENSWYEFQSILWRLMSDNTKVWCKPFVPNSKSNYSAVLNDIPSEGVELPGGTFLANVGRAVIWNNTSYVGSFLAPMDEFKALNPLEFAEEDRATFAGEELVAYRLTHFLNGVRAVSIFVDQLLREWEGHLVAILKNVESNEDGSPRPRESI